MLCRFVRLLDTSNTKAEDATSEADDLNNFSTEYVENTPTNAILKELKEGIRRSLSARLSLEIILSRAGILP